MIISYFIPEDGDDEAHPNIFISEEPITTLGQLKQNFPLKGSYHFRFRKSIGDLNVWMDVVDDKNTVPSTDGRVFTKVTRVTACLSSPSVAANVAPDPSKLPTPQDTKTTTSAPAPARVQEAELLGDFTSSPAPPVAQQERRRSERLLSFDGDDDQNQAAPAAVAADFENDFLGLQTASAPPTAGPMRGQSAGAMPMNSMDFLDFGSPASGSPLHQQQQGHSMSPHMQHQQHHHPSPASRTASGGGRGGFDAFANLGQQQPPQQQYGRRR